MKDNIATAAQYANDPDALDALRTELRELRDTDQQTWSYVSVGGGGDWSDLGSSDGADSDGNGGDSGGDGGGNGGGE
jgi:hypothetical protein